MGEELINEDFLHELRKLCEKKIEEVSDCPPPPDSDVWATSPFGVKIVTSPYVPKDKVYVTQESMLPKLPWATSTLPKWWDEMKRGKGDVWGTSDPIMGKWMEKIMSMRDKRGEEPPKGGSYKVSEWLE